MVAFFILRGIIMANHGTIYKKKTLGFGNLEVKRIVRATQERENRRRRRSAAFETHRSILNSERSPAPNTVETEETHRGQQEVQIGQTEDRRTKLLKWKAEKELQKKLQQQKKQPVFRAGIYHHKLNSPVFLHQVVAPTKPTKIMPQRITRATAKRIAAKNNCAGNDNASILIPSKPIKASKMKKPSSDMETKDVSFAPNNHQFKAPEGLPTHPLFGHEALDQTKTQSENLPLYFSPYVVSARGKRASRKEQLHNIDLAEYQAVKTSPKESNVQSPGTSNDGGDLTPSYFTKITDKEVMRLRALCQHWTVVKNEDDMSEDAQLIINQAIGQTNLLINKKIEQFRQLIIECESGCGEQLVTCQDLQGFWDMVYMQVEDCDSRFEKLIQLQSKNWKEEEPVVKRVIAAKKPAANKKIIPSKASSVRDMIRAARRKQMEKQKTENAPGTIVGKSSDETSSQLSRLSAVKFDGGFFMVESPKKIVTPKSIRKSTLSHQRQSVSGDPKHRRSALNLIRLSRLLKPPEIKPVEVESDPTIPYINCGQTPGKSILKRAETQNSTSCVKKLQNKVNFPKYEETPEGNIKNMSWLGHTNNITVDCGENHVECEPNLNVKKKLDLSDSDSDCEEDETQLERKSETSRDLEVNFLPKQVSNNDHGNINIGSSGNLTVLEIKPEECCALSPLRKDTVNVLKAVRSSRRVALNERNTEMVSECSNTHGSKSDMPLVEENFTTSSQCHKENERPSSPEITKRRRSTRKSVRFTGEDCTVCAEVKPTYPLTPRAKRRSSKLLESQNLSDNCTENVKPETPSTQNYNDLISWDTPKEPPPRVRRSLRIQNSKQ